MFWIWVQADAGGHGVSFWNDGCVFQAAWNTSAIIMTAHHFLWILSDAKSILGQKRFTKALNPPLKAPWGAGRAARGDDLTQSPSSGAFSPGFQQEQGRQGKGKQLRHQLQYHLPTCSARCQGQPHCKLLSPFLWAQSGISTAHPIFLFWLHDLVVETLSLNFS